jgi:MFS family permease
VHRERGPSTYWRVLRTGAAVRPFALSVVARLPVSMAPLGMLLLVQEVHGSYAVAGTVTGAFALGTAAGGPAWARLMDRIGQPGVVALTTGLSAGLLAAVALLASAGAGAVALVGAAALAGLTFPPMSPAMRGAWKVALPVGRLRQAGFALDAVAVETVFIGGPLLLSLLLTVGQPTVPLLTTAGLLLVGGLGYSCTSAARGARIAAAPPDARSHDVPHAPGGSALRSPGLVVVLAVAAGMALAFGHIDASLAATARERLGDPARLGLLFTAIAGGSATGGLVYGARRWGWRPQRQLPVLLAAWCAALTLLAPVLAADQVRLAVLLPLLFLAGLPIAPSLIVQQNLIDDRAGPHRSAEGQAWLSSAIMTASAAGTAACGVLLDIAGVPWAFAAAAVAAGCAALVAVRVATGRGTRDRRWRRPAS